MKIIQGVLIILCFFSSVFVFNLTVHLLVASDSKDALKKAAYEPPDCPYPLMFHKENK